MEHNINTTSKRDFSDEYFSNPEKPRLDFLWLEITNKCNLKCVHCYAESSQVQPIYQTISLDGWKNIIYDAYFYGCKRIQFIGGEVTISPYLIPLLEYANELGFSFKEIYTNGTVMSDDLLNLIKKINANLAFSLYSHDSLTHDLITQRKGSWAKTLASIKKCLYLYIPFRVGIVVMEENKEQLSETRDFLYSLGVKHISIDRIRGIGRGKNLLN